MICAARQVVKRALFFQIDKGENLSEKKMKNLRATGRNFVFFGERIGVAILQVRKSTSPKRRYL